MCRTFCLIKKCILQLIFIGIYTYNFLGTEVAPIRWNGPCPASFCCTWVLPIFNHCSTVWLWSTQQSRMFFCHALVLLWHPHELQQKVSNPGPGVQSMLEQLQLLTQQALPQFTGCSIENPTKSTVLLVQHLFGLFTDLPTSVGELLYTLLSISSLNWPFLLPCWSCPLRRRLWR